MGIKGCQGVSSPILSLRGSDGLAPLALREYPWSAESCDQRPSQSEGYVMAHGKKLSWIGKQAMNISTANAVWQMKTTRSASAYESTATFFSSGLSVKIYSVE